VVQAGARREVRSPDSHNARSLHCSQGTSLFTTTACTVCATGWLWPKQASQRLQSLGCASASLEMLAS
jgi:hypothetical protein